jgi:lambda family phage minor tail protein L
MAVIQEIVQDLNLENPIDLFTLSGQGMPTINFCNIGRVTFGGVIYQPVPCKVEWMSKTGEGSEPRVVLVISDVTGDVGDLIDNYTGLCGAELNVKRTWSIFLDGQPGANATQFTPFKMRVNQYTGIFSDSFEFTLMSSVTLERKKVPGRTYLRRCQYQLSSPECGASTVNNFDLAGNPTTAANRACTKDPAGCIRYQGNTRRYGGFLGVQIRG